MTEIDKLIEKYLEVKGWPQDIPEFKAALQDLILKEKKKARIAGFKDAKVACSFDDNCKHCRANMMTLGFLSQDDNRVENRIELQNQLKTKP